MAGNRVFRGPGDVTPITLSNRPVAAALLPGTWVSILAASIAAATSTAGIRPGILLERDFGHGDLFTAPFNMTDSLKQPYASGDTGIVALPRPQEEYSMAFAAGTYTFGQELTIGAAGRLVAAATTNIVVAYFDEAGKTLANGDLADVIIANFVTKP